MNPVHRCAAFALAIVLAGCGGTPPPQQRRDDEWHAPVQMLLRYAGPDGRLTRAQLEAGLRKDFDAADLNHDGVLEQDEVRAVNQERWKEDQSAISPLQDWNGDGVVDFAEFAATARALFNEYDRDGNGVLTPNELRPGGAAPQPPGQTQPPEHHGHRGGS
jgi:hypothetical protein